MVENVGNYPQKLRVTAEQKISPRSSAQLQHLSHNAVVLFLFVGNSDLSIRITHSSWNLLIKLS